MGAWNQPAIIPRQPTFLEQIMPHVLQFGTQLGLMKMSQNWQQQQVEKAQTVNLLSSGWEPASPFDAPQDTVTIGKRQFKLAPIKIDPVLGPNQKPLGGQYRVSGGGAKPQFITVAQGFQGPITSIGEGDPSGLPQGTVYQIDSKTNKIYPLYNPKSYALDRKKKALIDQFNLDESQATKLAQGLIVSGQDALGNPILIDKAENKIIPLAQNVPKTTEKIEETAPQPPPFQMTGGTAVLGTGPAAKIKEKVNNYFGWMTAGIPFKETSEARETIRIFNQHLTRRFVNNKRVPVAEQATVRGFLVPVESMFRDPDESANKLVDLKNYMLTLKGEKQKKIEAGNMSVKQLRDYTDEINDIDVTLSMMTSVGAKDAANLPVVTNVDEYDAIQSGERYQDSEGNIRIKQ